MTIANTQLSVGDRVRLSGSSLTACGVVVEILNRGYIKVLWQDLSTPTTHHSHSVDIETPFLHSEARSQNHVAAILSKDSA